MGTNFADVALFEDSRAPIVAALKRVFEEEINQEIERCAEEAAEKARTAVREKLGQLALAMFSEYEIARQGTRLTISVKIDDQGKNP